MFDMQNLKQQSQRLLIRNSEIITPTQTFNNNKDPFICGICYHVSSHPVISQCGHLYCWKCINLKTEKQHVLVCTVCHQHMQIKQMRPIYISGQQHHGAPSNARPKPTNIKPIVNPSGFVMFENHTQHLRNNIEIGRQVAGYSPLPSNAVLVLSNFSQNIQNMNNDEKQVTAITNKLQRCLIVSFIFVILGILLISNKV